MTRAASGEVLRCNGISRDRSELLPRLTVVAATASAVLFSSCGGSGNGSSSGATGYVYLTSASTLTLYSESSDGLAADLGSLFTDTSGGIQESATDPSGQFLYLIDSNSGLHVFAIDASSGGLTEVAGSPFDVHGDLFAPPSLAFDASGSHLYVLGTPGPSINSPVNTPIMAYSVNGSGAVTPLANYTIPSSVVAIVTAGNHLYAEDADRNLIIAFSIAASGELLENVPGSPFATDIYPFVMVVDPTGAVLYTGNSGKPTATNPTPGSISAFTIDSSTGALSPMPGNPLPIPVNGRINIDPKGKFLFVPVQGMGGAVAGAVGVSVYAINAASAALSAVAGSPFVAGSNPNVAITDPADQIVYVPDSGTQITEFSLATTGALTPLPGSPVAVGSSVGNMQFVSP